jgi:outer membrane protein TolC
VQSTISNTMANTRNAYWDLVFAIQAVEAAQNSLDISNKLVQDNQARVEIGTLAPIDIRSAEAEAANRRLTLVQAQATVRTAELALKRLIVSGTDDPMWSSSINPVDRPAATPEPINVDAAVTRALRERTDLQQSINNLKISDINLRNQVDQTRPQLDLTASYGLSGSAARSSSATHRTRSDGDQRSSGYFDALARSAARPADVERQAELRATARPERAGSDVARSKLSLEQANANLKALQLQIATDVANAALTVQSSLESVQAARAARSSRRTAQRDAEQVRSRHVDQLRSRPGAARLPRRAEQRAARAAELPQGARELRDRADRRHARRRRAVGRRRRRHDHGRRHDAAAADSNQIE